MLNSLGIHLIVNQIQDIKIKIVETGKANKVYVKNDNPAVGYHSSKNPFNKIFGAVPSFD